MPKLRGRPKGRCNLPERQKTIVGMLKDGKSVPEIADHYHITRQSMWQFVRRWGLQAQADASET